MAQMIPSEIFFGEDTTSRAELEMFNVIKNTPNTKDWIVFHSLNIKTHECLTFTESDFCILIPSRGIFLIEVKGGRIKYRNGRFVSIDKNNEEHEIHNPFDQVENAKYGIINFLKQFNFGNIPIATGVAFPDVVFDESKIEFDKPMVYDANTESFYDYIVGLDKLNRYKNKMFYKEFSGDLFARVRGKLREDFELYIPPVRKLVVNNVELKQSLTKQQIAVMDSISSVDRALVHGGAGTGKTYFAIELAKRMHNNGYKVGVFAYNILIADFIKMQLPQNKYPNIVTGAIIEYWIQYCKDLDLLNKDFDPSKLPQNKMRRFYDNELYKLILKAFQLKPLDLDVLILETGSKLHSVELRPLRLRNTTAMLQPSKF